MKVKASALLMHMVNCDRFDRYRHPSDAKDGGKMAFEQTVDITVWLNDDDIHNFLGVQLRLREGNRHCGTTG